MTAGESHGSELLAIIEGVPAGLELGADEIDSELARRQLGYGRGGRMKIETDRVSIVSGVRLGRTMGSPLAVRIMNADWENWKDVMAKEKTASVKGYSAVTVPRPGHADLPGIMKYAHSDIRNVLERASARETAARVAVGAVAKTLLRRFDIGVFSHVMRIGKSAAAERKGLSPKAFSQVDASPVRCLDSGVEKEMVAEIDRAAAAGESVGGVFEVVAFGLVPGMGSYVSGPQRLGGRIGGALMSIPAIKGVEIGDGFALAGTYGSASHDEIFYEKEKGFFRKTNHAGGLEGGMTNGEPLVARACMKPIPTLTKPLASVDLDTGDAMPAFKERSDICAVPAAAVVGEAMVGIELARALLEKFGGDNIDDAEESYNAYVRRIKDSWPRQ